MSEVLTIIILTGAAGLCIPLGGAIASFESIRPGWVKNELKHFVIALGGGILLGGVTIVLVPEGMAGMNDSVWGIFIFLFGGLVFFLIERYLGLKRQETPQLMGMLLDYIPEAIALGGLVVSAPSLAPLLALLIGLQNLPEGFNAYREVICARQCSSKKALLFMSYLAILGPVAGLIGYYFLSEYTTILAAIMLFASGGILYLIFQDIAPQSRLDKHWGPPLGAVLGFCVALLSETLMVNS
jgi:zinc transporter, ZIP family